MREIPVETRWRVLATEKVRPMHLVALVAAELPAGVSAAAESCAIPRRDCTRAGQSSSLRPLGWTNPRGKTIP
jgi:hypothetical protein